MEPAHWSMIGLLIDVVGAFLLAAEAIKVQNLLRTRDRFLKPLKQQVILPILIIFDENIGEESFNRKEIPVISCAGVIFALPVFIAYIFLSYAEPQSNIDILMELLKALLYAIGGIIGATLLLIICAAFVQGCIATVDFIDRHTPDGVVGIIGFLFLLAGFSLQFYGTYLSLNTPATP